MKKNLFRKFLALFLTGTMLAGVGCKDYDDDIDKVNDRIDQLETGKLSSIEEQIAAINSSIASLETAYKAADAELKTALEKQASDLAAAKSALEASIKSLEDTHDADIKKLTNDLATLGSEVEGYNTTLTAAIKAVADDLAANYYPQTVVEQKLADLDSKFAGEIAALDSKIAACNEAIDAIKKQIEEMQGLIDGKVDQSAYDVFTKSTNEALQKNAEAISVLNALCAGFPEGQTIKEYIDAAQADVVAMLDKYLLKETYDKFIEEYGEFKVDIEGRVEANEGAIETLESWKDEMTKDGGTLALLEQRLQEAIDAKTTLDEIKGTYNANCTEFLNGVTGIIASALEAEGVIGAELQTKLGDLEKKLQDQIDALANRIEILEDQVSDLAGRIQSLVYVPKSINGIANFGGIVLSANDNVIRLTTGAKSEMTFLVSPKTLAKKLAAQHNATKDVFSFVPEKITRAEAPKFEIEGDVEGTEDGKISMLVSTDYTYPVAVAPAVAETYAIALKVTSKSSAAKDEESSVDTGIEYTTAYIPTLGDDDNVIENIVLAKAEGEGEEMKLVEFPAAGAEYEMTYNQKEPLTMLSEYSFAYKRGETIISLEKAAEQGKWDVELDPEPVYTRTAWTVAKGMQKVTFDPAVPMDDAALGELVEITIEEGVVSNVGKTINDQLKAAIRTVDGTVNVATNEDKAYSATVMLKPFKLPDIENLNANISWTYEGYKGHYVARDILFDAAGENKLTKAQYDQLRKSIEADNKWVVKYDEEKAGTVNQGVTVTCVSLPLINTDGDAKYFTYYISGYKGGSGTLSIEKTVALGQAEEITLKGEITFAGLPELTYTMDAEDVEILYNSTKFLTVIETENFALEQAYKLLGEEQTYFADAEDFREFMRSDDKAAMQNNIQKNAATEAVEALVRYNGIGQDAAGSGQDRLCVDFMRSYVDFKAMPSYTFTAPEGACYVIENAGFKINIKGSVTIKKDESMYLAEGTGLTTSKGEPFFMSVEGQPSSSGFSVNDIVLTNAYDMEYPTDLAATPELKFTLVGLENVTGVTIPSITDATQVMDWNACGLDKVTVKATMTYQGVPVDERTFEVRLKNPIDIDNWKEFTTYNCQVALDTPVPTTSIYKAILAVKATTGAKKMVPLDIYNNDLVTDTGLTDIAKNAYDLNITFSDAKYTSTEGAKDFGRFHFDPAMGEFSVDGSHNRIAGTVTAEIWATFTYNYSVVPGTPATNYLKKEYKKKLVIEFTNK